MTANALFYWRAFIPLAPLIASLLMTRLPGKAGRFFKAVRILLLIVLALCVLFLIVAMTTFPSLP